MNTFGSKTIGDITIQTRFPAICLVFSVTSGYAEMMIINFSLYNL